MGKNKWGKISGGVAGVLAMAVGGVRGEGVAMNNAREVTGRAGVEYTARQLYKTSGYERHDLSGMNFVSGLVSGWNFRRQNLTNADFDGATVTGTKFNGAMISGARFGNDGFSLGQLYSTKSYQKKDLSGVRLFTLDLSGGNFRGQNLNDADFQGSNLSNASLDGANLTWSSFESVKLADAHLTGATLSGARLNYSNVTRADFSGAMIKGASFYSTTGFAAEQLYSTVSYRAGDLSGTQFQLMDMSGWDFQGKKMEGVSFLSSTVSGTNFSGASLMNTVFDSADISGAIFVGDDLAGVSFVGATMSGADFTGANVAGADFSAYAPVYAIPFTAQRVPSSRALFDSGRIAMSSGQMYSTLSYSEKHLEGIGLKRDDLTGWDLSGQNLSSASLSGATMAGANLSGAVVTGADFGGTGMTEAQLDSTASYQGHDLRGVGFSGLNMAGWNLSGQDLAGAVFASSIPHYIGPMVVFPNDQGFGGATLTNANFDGADLSGASFSSSSGEIIFAQFTSAISSNLSIWPYPFFPQISASDLTGATFRFADLSGADLSHCTITGADFTSADLRNANLDSAKGFTLGQLYSSASYQHRILGSINFSNLDLSGGDFSGQELSGAAFQSTSLAEANFNGAHLAGARFNPAGLWWYPSGPIVLNSIVAAAHSDLSHATFIGAELTDASFNDADVTGADFSWADLRGASGFVPTDSTLTANTIMPDGDIHGLLLKLNERLVIRNHAIGVTVDTTALFSAGSTVEFDLSSGWTSTVRFANGVVPSLGGTLDLELGDLVDPSSLVGEKFKLFGWGTSLSATDRFGALVFDGRLEFDLSQLYKTGVVRVTGVAAPEVRAMFAVSGVPESGTLGLWIAGGVFLVGRRRSFDRRLG